MSIKRVIYSRRAFVSLVAIGCLTIIAILNKVDTSMSIASIAVGLAASNSYQKRGVTPPKDEGQA